jgi:GNAT superfamily N-acetyltransferase
VRKPQSKNKITIHTATIADAATFLELVDALANYEKLTPPDAQARKRLIQDMSGTKPHFQAFIAEYEGHPAGYAIAFETYSSFLALPTLFIEDIFVLPAYRRKKVGYALFATLAEEALRRNCGRMEWTVLDWNKLAIDFYKRTGAVHMKEWQLFRLERKNIEHLL